jgi:hypothetical protein
VRDNFRPDRSDTYWVRRENPEARPPDYWGAYVILGSVALVIYDTSDPAIFGLGWCFFFVAVVAAIGEYCYRVIVNAQTKANGSLFAPDQKFVWFRWVALPMGIILIAVTLQTRWPLYARFALSRSALTRAAQRVEVGEKFVLGPQWVGLYHVDRIVDYEGWAAFEVGTGFLDPVGFCYRCTSGCRIRLSDDWCTYED